MFVMFLVVFFCKQKTAYEMRISDWSADVCSSDLMMQTLVPTGRANYEPNSLAEAGENGGPRASVATGFTTFTANDERNDPGQKLRIRAELRSEEHTSELQSLMRTSYAVFCLKKKSTENVMCLNSFITTEYLA